MKSTPRFPALSPLEGALLGLLQLSAQSGYDLRKLFRDTPLMYFSDSPGSIYPALRRLEKRGWIAGKPELIRSSRPRQVFTVTAEGLVAFRAWREAPVTREDVIWRLDTVTLRFAFCHDSRATARRIVRELVRELDAYVRELRAYQRDARHLTITGRLALEIGVEGFQCQLRWARRASRQLGAKGE